jgi:DNA-binding CsgD family transcriptional regulator
MVGRDVSVVAKQSRGTIMTSDKDQRLINSQALVLDNQELNCIQQWLNGDNMQHIALCHGLCSRTVQYLIVNSCAKMIAQAQNFMSIKTADMDS